jgi:hypothetical protein
VTVTTKGKGAVSATADVSLSESLKEGGHDLSPQVRPEVQLGKAELKEEASTAAKSAVMLGGAGFAAFMVVVLGSFAAAFGLGSRIGLGWGTLVVAGVWALLAIGLLMGGRSRLRRLSPKPERTMESLKEDARWARHPIS